MLIPMKWLSFYKFNFLKVSNELIIQSELINKFNNETDSFYTK